MNIVAYDEVQKYRKSEAHGGGDEAATQANFGKSWKDFPKSVYLLVSFGQAFKLRFVNYNDMLFLPVV